MTRKSTPVLVLALALLAIAAASPIAMRVDVETVATSDSQSTLSISTVIAPEDRGRIGTQARMRIKLFRGDDEILHRLLDVDVDDNGSATGEIQAGPGKYALQVELTPTRGDATGFWRGTITVSGSGQPVASAPVSTGTAVGEPQTRTSPTPSSVQKEKKPVSAHTENEPAPAADDPTNETEKADDTTQATVGAAAPAVAVTTEITARETQQVESPPATVRTRSENATAAPEPETPEPMPAPTPKIGAKRPVETNPTQNPALLSNTAASADSNLNGDPVRFLVALDVADENLSRASAVFEQFRRVAERGGNAAVKIETTSGSSTAALHRLATTLDSVSRPADRAVLVIVTDGRLAEPRAAWKAADETILQSDAQLLAVGLWNDDFNNACRKNLSRITVYSGGRFYLLQPGESTASVVEFFQLD